jgi:hypothetical protein
MRPQIEKVTPAGANKLGYMSDIAPVGMPLMGNVTARVLTIIITIYESTTVTGRKTFLFIIYSDYPW